MKILLLLLTIASVSGIYIECDFYDDSLNVIGEVYTCHTISMNFSGNSTHITGYSGQHLSGRSSADVKAVYLESNDLRVVPKGLLNFFPNKIALFIAHSHVVTLIGDELVEYPNLQWWAIGGTNVFRVPGNLFASNPQMRYIGFSLNQIEHVGDGFLDNLKYLEEVFWYEPCIAHWAQNSSQIPALIEALRHECPDVTDASGVHVRCEFHNENIDEVIGEVYYCHVTSMVFFDHSQHITSYSGQHLNGFSDTDVRGIAFYSETHGILNFIPKGLLNIFPNFIKEWG